MILKEIASWIEGKIPSTGFADGRTKKLYSKYVLRETALTGSVAMARPIVKESGVCIDGA